jgi:sarcosine oxidase subunit gamma
VTDRTTDAIGAPIAGHVGPAPAGVTLAETTFAAAWNIQGDAARAPFADEARRQLKLSLPDVPNATERRGALTALWLGPTSWLLVASDTSVLTEFSAQKEAVNTAGGALFDVTASSVAWTVGGPHAATVLAKQCPLDFHARAFAEGTCAQSVLGHVNALFYRRDLSSFTLLVARSYARGVWRTLCQSAAQYGYDILPPQGF